jgi:hypothetical protein
MSYQTSTPFPGVKRWQIITLTVSFSRPTPPPPTPTVKETIQLEIGKYGILNLYYGDRGCITLCIQRDAGLLLQNRPRLRALLITIYSTTTRHCITIDKVSVNNVLTLLSPVVIICTTHQFNIQQSYVLPTHCIYVFCIYLRTNSDLCHLQQKLIGLYNRDEKCLQRGTDRVFKHNSY